MDVQYLSFKKFIMVNEMILPYCNLDRYGIKRHILILQNTHIVCLGYAEKSHIK